MDMTVSDPQGRSLYRPLESDQVRLLRLNPEEDASELGSLEIADLQSAPPYYALSHSWTDQRNHTDVYIDGSRLTLGTDLVACVRRLSQLLRTGAAELDPPIRYVWIDSICIDQSNLAERSSQVALMGRLYRGSIRTLIWLGTDTANDDADCSGAWELLDHVYGVFRQQNPTASHPSDIPIRMFLQSSHDTSGLPTWDDEKWTHLARLVERRWFSRIWVVQEVVLSPEDPLLMHGQHSRCYPWSRFAWAVAWFRSNGYLRLPRISEVLRNVDTMASLQRAANEQLWPLDALVSITQVKFNATDQRDKIYGLMGLASDYRDDVPGLKRNGTLMKPDYSVGVDRLYPSMARFMLQRTRSLALLTRAHGIEGNLTRTRREHHLDLPSWCPDWSDFKVPNEGIATSLSWVYRDNLSEPARLGFFGHFHASYGFDFDPQLTDVNEDKDGVSNDPGKVLSLRGIQVSQIKHSVPFAVNPSRKIEPEEPFAARMAQILSDSLTLSGGDDDLLAWAEHFVKVTTVEQHHLAGRDWDQGLKDGMAYIHSLVTDDRSLLTLMRKRHGGGGVDSDVLTRLRELSMGGNADYYKSLVRNYGFDRAFLVTIDGRMGIGPSNIHQGDTIAVLAGGDVPYCLRRQDDHWLFVGEACVGGLMKGEAIHESRQGLLLEEVFNFR